MLNNNIDRAIAVSLAALSMVGVIVWDRYKTKNAIELQQLAEAVIIEGPAGIEKIRILYDNEPIPNLYRYSFALINTGRLPIQETDVLVFPKITISKDSRILDYSIEKKNPVEMEITPRLDKALGSFDIRFSLMNPRDFVRFSLLVTGKAPSYSATARIAGVASLKLVNRIKEFEGGTRKLPGSVIIVGIITLLLLIGLLFDGIPGRMKENKIKVALKDNSLSLPKKAKREDYVTFVSKHFSHRGNQSRENLLKAIKSVPPDLSINDEQQTQFESAVLKTLEVEYITDAGIWVMIGLIGLGVFYIWSWAARVVP